VPPRGAGLEALEKKEFKWQWLRRLEESTYLGYALRWRRARSNYLGMLRLIDDQVARLLARLESLGKARDTIVLCLADHWDYFCDYGLERKGAGLPEALTRIPMVWARWNIQPQKANPAFCFHRGRLSHAVRSQGRGHPRGRPGPQSLAHAPGPRVPKEEFETVYPEVGFGGMDYAHGMRLTLAGEEWRSWGMPYRPMTSSTR